MVIYGTNFGTDPSIISVKIGGKEAIVVSSKGNSLYCLTPSLCFEGSVEVKIGEQSSKAQAKYEYEPQLVVSTLCGYLDEYGKGDIKSDAPFNDCGKIDYPSWLSFDPQDHTMLYLIQANDDPNQRKTMRILDLDKEWISTGISADQGARMRSISWTPEGYMMIACAKGDLKAKSNYLLIPGADRNFKEPSQQIQVTTGKGCQSSMVHPINGELYYTHFDTGSLRRYDYKQFGYNNNENNYEVMFSIKNSFEFTINPHPSGDYIYLIGWFAGVMNAVDLEYGLQYMFVEWFIWAGIIKSLFFAFIIASVSAFFGYTVDGGSIAVGKASTDAVVSSSVLILFADLILTKLLMG